MAKKVSVSKDIDLESVKEVRAEEAPVEKKAPAKKAAKKTEAKTPVEKKEPAPKVEEKEEPKTEVKTDKYTIKEENGLFIGESKLIKRKITSRIKQKVIDNLEYYISKTEVK